MPQRHAVRLPSIAALVFGACFVFPPNIGAQNALQPRTGFASSVAPGSCVLELDLLDGELWGSHLLVDGRNTFQIVATRKGTRLKLQSAVRPQQTLQIDVVSKGQRRWLPALTFNEDATSWPVDMPCAMDTAATDPSWSATIDVGTLVNTFAGELDLGTTPDFRVPTEALTRPLVAPAMSVKAYGWPRLGGGAVWLDLQSAYSVNPSIACNRNPAPDYCRSRPPNESDIPDIIKSADSVTVWMGPRIDFATLGPDSKFPTRVYGKVALGSVWVLGTDGKARDQKRFVGGLRVANGTLVDTFIEGGLALNELVTLDNRAHWDRWYLGAGMSYTPSRFSRAVSTVTGRGSQARVFVRMAFDRASGPDYLQTSIGMTLDIGTLASAFSPAGK